jgi:hypothetical protein
VNKNVRLYYLNGEKTMKKIDKKTNNKIVPEGYPNMVNHCSGCGKHKSEHVKEGKKPSKKPHKVAA